jgi:hypothetical protein
MLVLVLAMTACSNSAAPEPSAGAAATPPPVLGTGRTDLEVRVVDLHGKPVVGAEVLLSVEGAGRGDGSRAATDGLGTVRFNDIAGDSSVSVWVSRGGASVGFAQVAVQAGRDNRHSIVLRLPGRATNTVN